MTKPTIKTATTLPFETFWRWIQAHPNCIVRAGTPETVLFDDEDLHWHFDHEEGGGRLVQLIRGKKVLAELIVQPGEIAYVQAEPVAEDEVIFELMSESADARMATYHFVLSHGYDEAEEVVKGRWTH